MERNASIQDGEVLIYPAGPLTRQKAIPVHCVQAASHRSDNWLLVRIHSGK
jgi:hypothetical protein